MSNRSLTLLGSGLLALIMPMVILGADWALEANRTTTLRTAINAADPAFVPAQDQPDPADAEPVVDPAVDAPSILDDATLEPAPEADRSPATNATDAVTKPDTPLDQESEQDPDPAEVHVDPMPAPLPAPPIQVGPPPLQREDLQPLTERLAAIEQNLAGQQERAIEMVLSSNRTALIAAGTFAGVGVLGMILAAFVMARVLNRLSDVVMTLPMGRHIDRTSALPPWGHEELHPTAPTAFEQVSARFLGAIEQLEKRIRELEKAPPTSNNPGNPGNAGRSGNGGLPGDGETVPPHQAHPGSEPISKPSSSTVAGEGPGSPHKAFPSESNRHDHVQALLVEGESLLQNDKAEQALEQFEDALAIEPGNADALIKRGMALERMQRMEAALESYDRAIASNGSLTLAYLHKGAVCNRLQRYREALECYERALQTEQKP